ncbi:MAG: beta strand repeat-containing protein, partial [Planctomyces sp.]
TNDNTLAFTSMDAAFNPTTGVTINGGTGANSFTFTNFGSSFTGALNILGNAGTDSTTFTTSLTTTVINVQTETTTISGISLSTSGGNMTFGGDVALNTGNVTLNTTGGNLSIAGNLSGAQDLTLAPGIAAGTTTIAGNVSNLGDGNGAALTIGNGITGLVWFQGSFAANSGITAFAGSSVRFNGDVTLGNGTVGTTLPGNLTLDGLNWSSFDDVALGTVTLSSAAVSLATNNGNLTFNGTVNGAQNLSAVAGTGTVIFANDVGSGTTIGSLTVTAATIQTSTGSDVTANGPVSFTATTANSLGGNITTCSDAITIIGNATLSSSVSLNTSNPGNSIQITGTVEGTAANSQALTLNAGTAGTVTVTGSIGKNTALQSLTLTNSNGATFGTLESDTIQAKTSTVISNSVAGSTVLFNGALVTDSLTSSGNAYHLHLAGTGSIIGTTSLQNAGQAIFGNSSADILLFLAPLSVTVPSSVELFGQIRTQSSTVLLGDSNTPVNLRSADSVVDTTNNMDPLFLTGATITFGSVIEGKTGAGSENLALNAGTTGDVVFAGTIGAARRMGTLHLRGLRNTILPSVTAQTLLQTTGTGTTTFNGTVNTTSATGVDITTTNIVVNALITTIVDASVPASAPGIVRLQATAGTASATTGIITMLDPGQIVSSNDVTIGGNRNVAPAILVYEATPAGPDLTPQTRDFITTTTAGADVLIESSINFISPGETANNNFIINTKAANGSITLQGAIDGNWNNFVLISGTGTVATTATAPMTEVATLTLQDNSGFSNGTINLNASIAIDWIEVYPQNYAVNILGSSNTVGVRSYYKYGNTQHPVFHNTGGVRFGDDATDYIWFRERLTSLASTTTVTGVSEANSTIAFGNDLVSDPASLHSTGGGDVNITGNVRGSGATLRFGENTDGFMNYRITGNVTLGTLTTFADDTSITFLEDVTLETPTTLLNLRTQLGDAADDITTVNGNFSTSAVALLSLGGTVATTGGAITISTVTLLAPAVLDTTSGGTSAAISVTRIVGNSSLAVDAGTTAGATIAIAEMAHLTGGLTVRNAGGLVTLGALGGSASGPVTITNSQNGVRFNNPLTASALTVNGTAAGSSILFEDGYLVRIDAFTTA